MIKKYVMIVIFTMLLCSCATKITSEASSNQQQEVKQQVLQLLEQEYKQPFKILDFKYEYKTHYPDGHCMDCRIKKYGTYHFKIKAVDNPIIIVDFEMNDGLAKE